MATIRGKWALGGVGRAGPGWSGGVGRRVVGSGRVGPPRLGLGGTWLLVVAGQKKPVPLCGGAGLLDVTAIRKSGRTSRRCPGCDGHREPRSGGTGRSCPLAGGDVGGHLILRVGLRDHLLGLLGVQTQDAEPMPDHPPVGFEESGSLSFSHQSGCPSNPAERETSEIGVRRQPVLCEEVPGVGITQRHLRGQQTVRSGRSANVR